MTSKPLKFKPYARLLTMLGDQLIRNEQVALSELIKNAYDADASWVTVTFEDFDEEFKPGPRAKIVVEDDGVGMTADVIENHWVNPATPVKLLAKNSDKRKTARGRIIQGEKGIGRFALLKLGRDVRIVTRPENSVDENVLDLKLSQYDVDFLDDQRAMFLDELELQLETISPATTIVAKDIDLGGVDRRRRPQGTRIEISPPVGKWTRAKVEKVYEDLGRLQSIFSNPKPDAAGSPPDSATPPEADDDFSVFVYRDDVYEPLGVTSRDRLDVLLKDHTVFKIEGRFDAARGVFDFQLNGQQKTLPEPPRVSRRPVGLSYAAIGTSSMAA